MGHKIKDCITLKDAMEGAVHNGELTEFVNWNGSQQGQNSRYDPKGKQKVRGTIHVIVAIDEDWADSNVKRRVHMRSVMLVSAPKRS